MALTIEDIITRKEGQTFDCKSTQMVANPYISKEELSKCVGISVAAISANITAMRGKYLNRVGPDKGGFWEVMIE